jgi:hypothetical protein
MKIKKMTATKTATGAPVADGRQLELIPGSVATPDPAPNTGERRVTLRQYSIIFGTAGFFIVLWYLILRSTGPDFHDAHPWLSMGTMVGMTLSWVITVYVAVQTVGPPPDNRYRAGFY